MSLVVTNGFAKSAEDSNFAINARAASGVEERLYRIRSQALSFLDMTAAIGEDRDMLSQLRNIFFERNPNIAEIYIPGAEEIVNRQFFVNNEIDNSALDAWIRGEAESMERASGGETVIRNVTPVLRTNLLALFYPWQERGIKEAVVVFFSPDNIAEITGTGSNTTVLVNDKGDVLVHPDFGMVLSGANISENPLFDALWKSSGSNVRLDYEEANTRFIGAAHRVSLGEAAIFSFQEYSLITGQISDVTRRNILLSISAMFVAVLITWFFSGTVTTPIKKLMDAAGRIELGEFDLAEITSKSGDELGLLTRRFVHMGKGLIEWEESKDLIGRFNKPPLMEKLRRGEIVLDGERLEAVVLHAALTSFNELSLDVEPAESLSLLNSFFAKMIASVEKTGGSVDRIYGDKLIAVWGIPYSSGELADNVMDCLRSALMMRAAIWELNSDRTEKDLPLFRLGCGIHTGNVLAGRMGAYGVCDYSISGETIDLSAGVQALSVPVDTDILISEKIQDLVSARILSEELTPMISNKKTLRVFGLVNLTPAKPREKQRWPFTLQDVRESLGGGRSAEADDSDDDGE
jgi:adenylate cyclase